MTTAELDAERHELDTRRLFRCTCCLRVVPWSYGGSDEMPDWCDGCWYNPERLTWSPGRVAA